jgi:hypothetical protein
MNRRNQEPSAGETLVGLLWIIAFLALFIFFLGAM